MAVRELQKGDGRDGQRRMAAASKAAILALLCTILLEGAFALYRAGRGYGADSPRFPLKPCEYHDYMAVPVQGAVNWIPTGTDPWLRFAVGQEVGHIRILLAEPLAEDTSVHLYYAAAGQFHRFQRKDGYLAQGTREAVLTVPPGHWDSLRLDILGAFTLEGLEGAGAVSLKDLPPEQLLAQVRWGKAAALLLLFEAVCLLPVCRRKTEKAIAGAVKVPEGAIAGASKGPEGAMAGASKGPEGAMAGAAQGTKKEKGIERAEKKGAKDKSRIVYLDGIRTLAAILVIAAHVLAPLEGQYFHRESPVSYFLFLGCMFFALSCNLLFFMLSGALLLPDREEGVAAFIRKRFLKVALPLLVYSVFYVRLMCFSALPWKSWAIGYGKALLTGQMAMAPHLWLVYALIGMYVLVLPLRALLKSAPKRTQKQLAFLTILFLGIRTIGQYLGQEPGISLFLEGWTGIFLMGYFLTRDWMRRYDRIWLAGGAAAFLLSLWIGMERQDYGKIVYNCSLLMLAIAAAIFIAMSRLEPFLKRFARPLAFASRYSYSILLIHWYVLYGLLYCGLLPGRMPLILQILLPILACTAVSLALAVFVDRTVVAVLEKAAGLAADAIKKGGSSLR